MVCLRKSARSAEDIVVSSVRIDRVLLHAILSQIAQISQTNAASQIDGYIYKVNPQYLFPIFYQSKPNNRMLPHWISSVY